MAIRQKKGLSSIAQDVHLIEIQDKKPLASLEEYKMGLREDLKRALERQKGVVSVGEKDSAPKSPKIEFKEDYKLLRNEPQFNDLDELLRKLKEREEAKERMKRLELQGGRECARCGILESDYGEKFEDMVVVKGSLELVCKYCLEDGE
jgi:hypothetical protein